MTGPFGRGRSLVISGREIIISVKNLKFAAFWLVNEVSNGQEYYINREVILLVV